MAAAARRENRSCPQSYVKARSARCHRRSATVVGGLAYGVVAAAARSSGASIRASRPWPLAVGPESVSAITIVAGVTTSRVGFRG